MRGVAVLTITGVLSQLVGFVYRIGLTRLAGAEILGLYQLILPVYSVLLSLTSEPALLMRMPEKPISSARSSQ